MKISKTTSYTGPNLFSRQSVTHYIIVAEDIEGVPFSETCELLALAENAPLNGRWAVFAQSISSGDMPTWRRVFLEVFIRLNEIMGVPIESAEIRSSEQAGQWELTATVTAANPNTLPNRITNPCFSMKYIL